MILGLKYGKGSLELALGGATEEVLVLESRPAEAGLDSAILIRNALANPIESPPLSQLVRPGRKIALVTSDITRPCPSDQLLPPVLKELAKGGVRDEDITVVFGLGGHRAHTLEEQQQLVGQAIYERLRCVDSDPGDVELLGTTSRGTPVLAHRPVVDADVRVCLGVIGYHYFVGFSGGLKALVPGVCGIETIRHNHSMMVEPGAGIGRLDGNPVREDIEEAGQMIGADFCLNVVLTGENRIVDAVAGDPLAAHRAGCATLDALERLTIDGPMDLVIVSAGGYPKDINLYQAQKALDNAYRIVRPGGIIILVAECSEGLGNPVFEEWMQDPDGPDAIVARIRREFVLGGHKAAVIARVMQHADVYMLSALKPDFARSIGFQPFEDLTAAFQAAGEALGPAPRIAVMPKGSSTLVTVQEQNTE
jgi:nickel-dependent lactate racemase